MEAPAGGWREEAFMRTCLRRTGVVFFGAALLVALSVTADSTGAPGQEYTLACGGNYSSIQSSN